uniref:Ig-like domain-containing protein n=1 Tax=Cyclopterus lumpus TaxID=8103 RepID=A0A8C2ZGJ5_CYCLU
MAVYLKFLLIVTGLTGIHSITTVSRVPVKAGDSISIPCLYGSQYTNHVKYLCKGYYWTSCSTKVTTETQNTSKKFSISDDKIPRIFTVTVKNLTVKNSGYYWCAVEINKGSDVRERFRLSVTRDVPPVSTTNHTINCYYNPGEMWCRLGSSCVSTDSSGSINGTGVTINASVPNVFTVMMSGLKKESSGWYQYFRGDIQIQTQTENIQENTEINHHPSYCTCYNN